MDKGEQLIIGGAVLLALVGGGLYLLKVTTGIGPKSAEARAAV